MPSEVQYQRSSISPPETGRLKRCKVTDHLLAGCFVLTGFGQPLHASRVIVALGFLLEIDPLDLDILESGIGFKIMLPQELHREVERETREFHERARLDKQNVIPAFQWTGESLYDLA
ncbi:MAG: hypothetical protein ACPGPS_17700, partial [Rubripirellula sp.]